MLISLGIELLLQLVGMSIQVVFYATTAYWVAKMAHKGWKDGK